MNKNIIILRRIFNANNNSLVDIYSYMKKNGNTPELMHLVSEYIKMNDYIEAKISQMQISAGVDGT